MLIKYEINLGEQKNDDEKAAIQRKYQSLNAAQLKKIKKQTHSNIINVENIDPFPYYLMCNDIARINLMILEDSIRATAYVGRALVDGLGTLARGMGGRSGGGNGGGGSSGGSTDEGMLYVIGIAGFIALISSGLVAGAYALKKVYNSLKNLTEQKKMLRFLFCLSSIGIGGYYGAVEFAALGALFGSFVPGIGTATGALIGAIFGTGIGAGLGALISKYIAKALSYIAYEHENNPSNPEKYKLTEAEIAHLKREHLDVKTINRMLRAARKEKNNVGIMGSFPETNERQHKDLWNVRIKQIKSGKIDKLEIAGRIYNARFNELGKPYFSEEDSTTMIHHHLDMIQKSLIPIPDDKLLQNKEIDLNWQIEPQPSAPPSHSLTF